MLIIQFETTVLLKVTETNKIEQQILTSALNYTGVVRLYRYFIFIILVYNILRNYLKKIDTR